VTERLWLDISATEYHDLPAVSSGGLKTYEKAGPLEYHAAYVAKTKVSEETTAKRMGTAFHQAMEDPATWENGYVILPSVIESPLLVERVVATFSETSKAKQPELGETLNMKLPSHRMYVDLFTGDANADGCEVLTVEQYEIIDLQIASVYDNKDCLEFVGKKTSSNVEMACVWECPLTGLAVKALVDLLVGDTVVDFKTTKARNPYEWLRDVEKLGYGYQLAHYLYVTGKPEFRFITVTSEEMLKTGSHCEANLWHGVPADLTRWHDKNISTLHAIASHARLTGEFEDLVDGQGVPFAWHNEGWGEDNPLSFDYFSRSDG
jgi:hypothetical protein